MQYAPETLASQTGLRRLMSSVGALRMPASGLRSWNKAEPIILSRCAAPCLELCLVRDVRFGPKADISLSCRDVRFASESGHSELRSHPHWRWLSQTCRHCDVPCLVQPDGSGGCWRQVDVSTSDPRAAVVDANRDASAVANAYLGADRQPAMGSCHCCTI
jgi:hypothetical protein